MPSPPTRHDDARLTDSTSSTGYVCPSYHWIESAHTQPSSSIRAVTLTYRLTLPEIP